MNNSHEQKVEAFYSCGAKNRSCEAEGFLSFGYWNRDTKEYYDAAQNLVNFFLNESNIERPAKVLDVACGYGAESFRFFEAIKPEKMYCVDITKVHIDTAKRKAEEKQLQEKILFEKKDACRTDYPDNFFSHIMGIEGPAHFRTRLDFFHECYRLLETKGKLILTDIIFDPLMSKKTLLLNKITEFGAQRWHMPKENWISSEEYCNQLRKIGFRVEKIFKIGDKVFPAFAAYNTRLKSILRAVKTRGLFIGIGLSIISWLLGYGYRHGVIDYIFVKAEKI